MHITIRTKIVFIKRGRILDLKKKESEVNYLREHSYMTSDFWVGR